MAIRDSSQAIQFRAMLAERYWEPSDRAALLKEYVAELHMNNATSAGRVLLTGSASIAASLVTAGQSIPVQALASIGLDQAAGKTASIVDGLLRGGQFSVFLDDELGSLLSRTDGERRDVLEIRDLPN